MIARRSTIKNALRIAADHFDQNAVMHADPTKMPAYKRVEDRQRAVSSFLRQAQEARDLADRVEHGCRITLED
jgi:hypothetical protein